MLNHRLLLSFMFLLTAVFQGCILDGDGQGQRMTLDQRSTQTISGLGLSGEVSISVGDIDRGLEIGGDSNLHKRVTIEDVMVSGGNKILAQRERMEVGSTLSFVYRERTFEIFVERTESHTLRADKVGLLVTEVK